MTIEKHYGTDFTSDAENYASGSYTVAAALTLDTDYIGENSSGWTITGDIHEDYHEWVNYFEAEHQDLGKVWGDFEDTVYATSEEAYQHFFEHHPPSSWDYRDI